MQELHLAEPATPGLQIPRWPFYWGNGRDHPRGRRGQSGLPKLSHFSHFQAQGEVVLHGIFRKTVASLQNYRKWVKISPCFKFIRLSLSYGADTHMVHRCHQGCHIFTMHFKPNHNSSQLVSITYLKDLLLTWVYFPSTQTLNTPVYLWQWWGSQTLK